MPPDINHPASCLALWRDEATQLRRHESMAGFLGMTHVEGIFGAQAAALERCATMLENRLIWSGLIDRPAGS